MIINHNMPALNTYRQMTINTNNTTRSLEKLSSGLRINKAGDDAAGLAISEKMRGQIRGLDQASRNSQDAISLISTAEGALSETHSILQRMRELAVQSSNDTNTSADRGEIQKEVDQLTNEVNRIGNTTQFNTKKLLNGQANVTASVTAKLTGGSVADNFTSGLTVIDTATKATATSGAVSGSIELLNSTGSTVNGTKAYATNVGPNTNETAAVITGAALAGNVSIDDGGGKILTGTKVYTDPSLMNSGPKVERTSGTATGASLTGTTMMISDKAGATATGTKAYVNPTAIDTGPNVTASDNELSVTLNGVTKTVTLAIADYSAGGGDGAATFAADIQTKLNTGGSGFGAGAFSVGFDAKDKLVITALGDNAGVAHEFSIDGGGTATTHLLTAPSDNFAVGTQEVNNTVELNIKFANGDPDAQRIVVLENAGYDITVGADKTALLADINDSLKSAQKIGENGISTGAALDVNAATKITLSTDDGAAGAPLLFELDEAALEGLFDGTQTAQEVADKLNSLTSTVGAVAFSSVATAVVNDGKLVITSKQAGADSQVKFAISDASGGADKAAIQSAFGMNHMAAAAVGTVAPAAVASFDVANNKLIFTATDNGAGSVIDITGGKALTDLKLDNATEVAGTENNELVISFDGGATTTKISLTAADYSVGGNDGADTFAAAIETKIQGLAIANGGSGAVALGLSGVTDAQLDEIKVTVGADGKIAFNTKDSGVNLSISAGVASTGAEDVDGSGKNVVLNAGQSGSQYNDLTVTVELDAGNAGNSASMTGNAITVKIGTGTAAGDAITTDTLQALIRGASGATVDLSKFAVSGNDTATKQDYIDEGAFTIAGGTNNAGGLESLLKAVPADTYGAATETQATNQIEVTANGVTKTLTLTDTDSTPYDVTTQVGKDALVADIQTQLNTAFGTDVVKASFDQGLVLTDSVTGTASTFGAAVSGNGAANLKLDTATVAQGGDFNDLTVTYQGTTKTLELNKMEYDGTAGKTTDDFLADIQTKLDTAFGSGNIAVSLDNSNKVMFTTKVAGESISIGTDSAAKLLLANSGDSFAVDLSGDGNNTLELTVGDITKEITITEGTYNLDNVADRDAVMTDMNTKLDEAFGAGNVVASFNANNALVFTSNAEGSTSTIGSSFSGDLASTFKLDSGAIVVSGLDANNKTTLTIDGTDAEITLTEGTYNAGGMASELQSQIRAVSGLEKATVSYTDGKFEITSGKEGGTGSVVASAGVLGDALGLSASAGATATAGVDAKNQALRMQIGSNSFESISVDISDMTGDALGISSAVGGVAKEFSDSSAEAVFRETKTVNNGTDDVSSEYSLDVSTYENATAAVTVLDEAIASVSAERSKLGAFTNRLEHTIANLGTSSENLTAAESRVRDVDMAKEMMAFQKNNILTQAAQAMMAQANQLPQGVLQLLR